MQHLMFSTQFKPRIHDLYPSVSHSESQGVREEVEECR